VIKPRLSTPALLVLVAALTMTTAACGKGSSAGAPAGFTVFSR